jgi:hypothetical protein
MFKYLPHKTKTIVKVCSRLARDRRVSKIIVDMNYIGDDLITSNFTPFDAQFLKRYERAIVDIPEKFSSLRHIHWRLHIVDWCIENIKDIEGVVVEFGVWYGVMSKFLLENNISNERAFELFDIWGRSDFKMKGEYKKGHYEDDIFKIVKNRFDCYPNVELIRGILPDSAKILKDRKIALILMDLNDGEIEKQLLEEYWANLQEGGIIYFDDYGQKFPKVRKSIDEFVGNLNRKILTFPSGQGILIK